MGIKVILLVVLGRLNNVHALVFCSLVWMGWWRPTPSFGTKVRIYKA